MSRSGREGSQGLFVRSAAAALLAFAPAFASQADDTRVITHPSQKSARLDRNTLRAYYVQRVRTWPDGTPVRLFVMDERSPQHETFVREKLGTYPYVLRGAWDRAIFTGGGVAPTVVHSEQEMRQKVESTPGAIGYVNQRESSRGGGS